MTRKNLIAVLGFGSQGQAVASNLNDSGYNAIVGLRMKSKSNRIARRMKIRTASLAEAVTQADLVIVALPDHLHGRILNDRLFKQMTKRPALVFLHGTSIHFQQVVPPDDIPILLLAPHAPGVAVRDNYLTEKPFSAFYSVHHGARRKYESMLFKLAKAIGIPRTHLIKTTVADEAVGDLFGEQAVLCGGLARLIKFGFETLVETGMPPQNAYLEVAYQLDLIVDLVKKNGLAGMFDRISPMARYGSVVNGPKIITEQTKKNMKRVLTEIESGKFVCKIEKNGLKLTKEQTAALTNSLFDRQVKRFKK
ncbi:MAG: ketol-acid reductoisomerase [FCB group bacterium]|nr:ketol-acid reductoisomerase [FCB group bacterium]